MKVLITSLQVSLSASHGHLNPALALAEECIKRGHEVSLLPLPSEINSQDHEYIKKLAITCIPTPNLTPGILKSSEELAALAKSDQPWQAYNSFIMAPLWEQYEVIKTIIKKLNPDIVLYDLLLYGPPLAARSLGIAEAGFCAGLKLVAEDRFLKVYQDATEKISDERERFLKYINISASFRNLEILSNYAQFIFAPEILIKNMILPPRTRAVGPLLHRKTIQENKKLALDIKKPFALLSFGSVLDPADFMPLTDAIVAACKDISLLLYISSKKLAISNSYSGAVFIYDYLPLASLLQSASIFIHHGGANSFSEALSAGVGQILIPLTTDQPIQASLLLKLGAGFSMDPREFSQSLFKSLLIRLLCPSDPVHQNKILAAQLYNKNNGAQTAIDIAEKIISGEKYDN